METGRIVRHVPAYVDLDGPPQEEKFLTLDGLLEIPFVRRLKDIKGKTFHRFSVSWQWPRPTLMVEYDGGKEFYVIGYLYDNLEVAEQLPKWEIPDKK